MEVAVSAVLVAMLAAVTAPYLIHYIDRQRAQTAADKLSAVATGIAAFSAAIHTAAGATNTSYPGKISELANVIVSNSTVTHNSCGSTGATVTFNNTATTSWNTSGPFVTFMISTTGLVTPIGTIADSMVRSPLSASVGTLSLQIPSVETTDATNLDQIVDGGDGGSAGTVRWTANGNQVDVTYLVPVGARC
jgi:Tfp pilus assembly protein PilE